MMIRAKKTPKVGSLRNGGTLKGLQGPGQKKHMEIDVQKDHFENAFNYLNFLV